MNLAKRFVSLVAGAALTLSSLAVTAFAATEETVIKIFHTNDVHSRFEATIGDSGELENFGYARMKTLVNQNSGGADKVFVFDAGDTFHGLPFATISQGESIARVMGAVGYDAMVAGNHDFNYGSDRTVFLSRRGGMDLLGANVKTRVGRPATGFSDYKIYDVDGVKVGVFGLSTPETAYKTNPKNVERLQFKDPAETAEKIVNTLRNEEKVNVVICLAHLGIDPSSGKTRSTSVAEKVQGIDLIIDGHSHSEPGEYPAPTEVNGTVITSTGEYLQNLGMVTITVNGRKVAVEAGSFKATDYQADALKENTAVKEMIESIQKEQEKLLNVQVATTPVALDGEREHVRTGETNLSRLITSAMLEETGADIALTNGGGIRASIAAGPVTVGDVQTVLPFGNYVVTIELTGAELKAAVEHGLPGLVDGALEPLGRYAQIAGLELKYDPTKPAGSRILSLTHNGAAVEDDAKFIVATNDFMAVGGDDYTMLKKPIVNEYNALDEVLISYLNKVGQTGIQKIHQEDRVQEAA